MKIKGQEIYMVRGDNESLTAKMLERKSDGSYAFRSFASGESAVLRISEWNPDVTAAPDVVVSINGIIYDGEATFKIEPTDTSTLKFGRGVYVYSIEATLANGDKATIVPATWFTLLRGGV